MGHTQIYNHMSLTYNPFHRYALSAMFRFNCSNHKLMLLAKALRDADHTSLTLQLGPNRDVGEFRTTNLIDMLQLQVSTSLTHILSSATHHCTHHRTHYYTHSLLHPVTTHTPHPLLHPPLHTTVHMDVRS